MDMVAHTLDEKFLCHRNTILALEHPRWALRVPYETMSYDEHIVCLAIVNELVCPLEVELSLNRLKLLTLHAVLCNDRVKMLLYRIKS
jgi:hypothetical protein